MYSIMIINDFSILPYFYTYCCLYKLMSKKGDILIDKRGGRTFVNILKKQQLQGQIRLAGTQQKSNKSVLIHGMLLSSPIFDFLKKEEGKGGLKCIKHTNYLATVGDPFICNYPLDSSDGFRYYFVAYQKQNKTLASVIETSSQQQIIDYMIQLCQALKMLHNEKNRFHGCLQPQNIFLMANQNVQDKFIIKIEQPIPQSLLKENRTTLNKRSRYYSPQFFQKKQSKQSDIWNLGLIFLELVMKKRLVQYKNDFGQIPSLNQNFPICVDFLKNQNSELIKKMLKRDISERIKLQQLLEKLEIIEPESIQLNLVQNENQMKKNQQCEKINKRASNVDCDQKRVILKGFVMSLKYYESLKVLQISLLFRQNLVEYLQIAYEYELLPQKCKNIWRNLKQFFIFLSEQTKESIYFLTSGRLKILKKKSARIYISKGQMI